MKLTIASLFFFFVFQTSVVGAVAAELTGEALYQQYCSICHGSEGKGDGHAAVFMSPKPRDFSTGLFKLRSTLPGQPPSDSDLLATITKGMHGSLMPSFEPLPEQERKQLVTYVRSLVRTKAGSQDISKPKALVIPPEPRVTRASLARGKELYRELGCGDCHGEQGKGDGQSANDLKDQWGYGIRPTDFTRGVFKGGAESRELYKRTATGMEGTPMPSYGDDLIAGKDRWALVHYIQFLARNLAAPVK